MVNYFLDHYCPNYFLKPKTRKVFVIGFPKCGTVSFHRLMIFLGYKSAHHMVQDEHVGKLMKENHQKGLPLLSGKLEQYNAFTQMDFCTATDSVYPQIEFLEQLIKEHPDGYFILNTRNLDGHIKSILNWENFAKDLEKNGHFQLGKTLEDHVKAIGSWILHHQQRVRQLFQQKYSKVSFLDLQIDREDVEDQLKAFFECPKLTFPHHNNSRLHRYSKLPSYASLTSTSTVSSNTNVVEKQSSESESQVQVSSSSSGVSLRTDKKVIVLGLPFAKEDAIVRLARRASLTFALHNSNSGIPLATIMSENAKKRRPLLQDDHLTDVNVFVGLEHFETGASVWPQWTMVETLIKQYPNATFVLNKRKVEEHADAIMASTNEKGEKYFNLFLSEDVPGFRHDNRMHAVYVSRWIQKHYNTIKDLFKKYPNAKLVEIDMDDVTSLRRLSELFA